MKYVDVAIVDVVSQRSVYQWIDRLGRKWLAEGPWSLFRVANKWE